MSWAQFCSLSCFFCFLILFLVHGDSFHCHRAADKSGCVSADMLIKIIKHDFGLTIDIEELIRAIDTDGSGEIEFEEFKTLLS